MSNHMIIDVVETGKGYAIMTVADSYSRTFFTFNSVNEIHETFPNMDNLLEFIGDNSEEYCGWIIEYEDDTLVFSGVTSIEILDDFYK